MSSASEGLLNRAVTGTPVATIDFETTGLRAGGDRVVEVTVVRSDPGKAPRIVLDTLVNPNRPMAATEIHGITDEDVADAPFFEEIAEAFVDALAGSMVAAYNVYFDISFLEYELGRLRMKGKVPHLCLMYLRPMLGLGGRCCLTDACRCLGVPYDHAHLAAADALAGARLWNTYLGKMEPMGVRTFSDLARLKSYKFVTSFDLPPLPAPENLAALGSLHVKSRAARLGLISKAASGAGAGASAATAVPQPMSRQDARREYWGALCTVLSDLVVTDEELAGLGEKKRSLGLSTEEVRSLHAQAFASAIQRFTDDHSLDNAETETLRRLHECLRTLGWAPGE